MTTSELNAQAAIQRIPQMMGDINQTLVRIAAAVERQNVLMDRLLGKTPSLPSTEYTKGAMFEN